MLRIQKKELTSLAFTLNKTFAQPLAYHEPAMYQGVPGQLSPVTAVGHFYIDQAGHKYLLRQTVSKTGGARDVFNLGYQSPRPLFDLMQAYLSGAHEQRRAIARLSLQPNLETQNGPT